MDAVSATDEAFEFIDKDEIEHTTEREIESESQKEEDTEFEGFGSMFD